MQQEPSAGGSGLGVEVTASLRQVCFVQMALPYRKQLQIAKRNGYGTVQYSAPLTAVSQLSKIVHLALLRHRHEPSTPNIN